MMKKLIKLFSLTLLLICSFSVFSGCNLFEENASTKYNPSADVYNNPDRGFYSTLGVKFLREGNTPVTKERLISAAGENSLLHFRFGLEDFSSSMGGASVELTEDMLSSLNETFMNLLETNLTAVIRFSYDRDGNSPKMKVEPEPELSLIKKHIADIVKTIKPYRAAIAGIETGMLGPWGEQHTSVLSENKDAYYEITEEWLKIEGRGVTLRRPAYVLHWLNKKYGTEYTIDKINEIDFKKYSLNGVGVYNDGYLGSETDLNTFTDRAKETDFLKLAGQTALYGGEVTFGGEKPSEHEYFSIAHIEKEAPITRLSYLNSEWKDSVLDYFRETSYAGADALYGGKSVYEFLSSKMGYCLRLAEVKTVYTDKVFKLELSVKNDGFANIVNRKKAELIISNSRNTYTLLTNFDFNSVLPGETKQFSRNLVPSEYEPGLYGLYLRISDVFESQSSVRRGIRFSSKNEYNAELGANKLTDIIFKG